MARTINEIYNEIVLEKDNQTQLSQLQPVGDSANGLTNDLSSGSFVAIWRLWAYVTAVSIWAHENIFDLFTDEINAKIELTNYGTNLWWVDRMKKFQFGDDLVVVDIDGEKVLTYFTIDEIKQIIDFVSISDTGDGGSIIKIAKDDGTGEPEPLTTNELLSAIAYVDELSPAGAKLGVISRQSDLAKYTIELYYNPLLDLSIIKTNVENAVENYHKNLEFNGAVILSKLVDSIQAVDGVFDLVVVEASAKPSGGVYESFNRIYETSAGSIKIDDTFPLSSTITYFAK